MNITQGAWIVGDGKTVQFGEEEMFAVGVQGDPWQPIAVLSRTADTTDEDRANARLIAAAPDLLAALREIAERGPNELTRDGIVSLARAAISKAAP